MKTLTIEITLNEEMLGMSPSSEEVYTKYIASKNPEGVDKKEAEALPNEEQVAEGTTVFPRDEEDRPFLWDYQMKGFFKDAAGCLRRVSTTKTAKLKAYKKIIDGLVFVTPRQIPICVPDGTCMSICERPLRASTAQGERIALARSETVPPKSVLRMEITLLDPALEEVVREWLDYGKLRGLGQWRNSGKGVFSYEVLD